MIFPENIQAILETPSHIRETIRILEQLPVNDGKDEITLSDKRLPGRIVVFRGSVLRKGAERPFRDFVQALNPNFQGSIVRNGNYGRFRTAHSPEEYRSF